MKIAVLGGGLTGLSAAHYLSKKNRAVFVFEKEALLGGLASGFKEGSWDWSLELTYHHLFANDNDIFQFAKEIGFEDFIYNSPQTASLFLINNIYRIIPVDTPQDFISLPMFNLVDKLRAGMVIAALKLSPFLPFYEKQTAKEFLVKTMGKRVWIGLWEELFRKKFGKYAENILASFIWARIKKRTKKLIYIKGGFQSLINHIEKTIKDRGVVIYKNRPVERIEKIKGGYMVNGELFDAVVSTLPTPVVHRLAKNIFPAGYLDRLKKNKYLHAISLIIETDQPLFDKTYWLNINVKEIPFVGLVQHTNMIDKKHYGGKHLLYVANYVDGDSKLLKMSKEEILDFYLPYLKKINSKFLILNSKLFVSLYAQPVFDKDFIKNKPGFETPAKNFYIANLDMTYPYDRGTNYAVKLGRQVSTLI